MCLGAGFLLKCLVLTGTNTHTTCRLHAVAPEVVILSVTMPSLCVGSPKRVRKTPQISCPPELGDAGLTSYNCNVEMHMEHTTHHSHASVSMDSLVLQYFGYFRPFMNFECHCSGKIHTMVNNFLNYQIENQGCVRRKSVSDCSERSCPDIRSN